MKLKEDCYELLKTELENSEGPFSKTDNVMLVFDIMAKNEELTLTEVTIVHLANIIKVLCSKLKWNEESSVQDFVNGSTDVLDLEVENRNGKVQENVQRENSPSDVRGLWSYY